MAIAPGKLDHVLELRARGANLSVVLDNVEAARAVAARKAGRPHRCSSKSTATATARA